MVKNEYGQAWNTARWSWSIRRPMQCGKAVAVTELGLESPSSSESKGLLRSALEFWAETDTIGAGQLTDKNLKVNFALAG